MIMNIDASYLRVFTYEDQKTYNIVRAKRRITYLASVLGR